MNVVIVKFLQQIRAEAECAGKDNFARAFSRALKSVRDNAETIKTVSELRALKNVGPYIAARIEKYLKEKGTPLAVDIEAAPAENGASSRRAPTASGGPQHRPAGRAYQPRYRTAAFALLVAMRMAETEKKQEPFSLTKQQLIPKAQPFCDEHLVSATKFGAHCYDAWTAMKSTLVKKELVDTYGNPPRFELSFEGRELAERLLSRLGDIEARGVMSDFDAGGKVTTPQKKVSRRENRNILAEVDCDEGNDPKSAEEFEIVLLVDNRELFGCGRSRHGFQRGLSGCDIPSETTVLEVGDAVFVARRTDLSAQSSESYILDHIIERKTVFDLVSSMWDGRYERQKFFMRQCGLENRIIVVEGDLSAPKQIPRESLEKALLRVEVEEDFIVCCTKNMDDTITLYKDICKWVARKYRKWTWEDIVHECKTFEEWNEGMKVMQEPTLMDVYWHMLLQIPGLGKKKIETMMKEFHVDTFAELIARYRSRSSEIEGRKLLKELAPRTCVSTELSAAMYKFLMLEQYGEQRFHIKKKHRTETVRGQSGTSQSEVNEDRHVYGDGDVRTFGQTATASDREELSPCASLAALELEPGVPGNVGNAGATSASPPLSDFDSSSLERSVRVEEEHVPSLARKRRPRKRRSSELEPCATSSPRVCPGRKEHELTAVVPLKNAPLEKERKLGKVSKSVFNGAAEERDLTGLSRAAVKDGDERCSSAVLSAAASAHREKDRRSIAVSSPAADRNGERQEVTIVPSSTTELNDRCLEETRPSQSVRNGSNKRLKSKSTKRMEALDAYLEELERELCSQDNSVSEANSQVCGLQSSQETASLSRPQSATTIILD
mmetsp:Transcript_9067/g.27254  ORF Transcript_9067/g.27254 Transcript_9067/m.27254 type:complete len:837 (+) Transcript_9067:86-2596(+)|eukprot:CAMPEP_0198733000 /NCGR_PEP_ID=MMETSP1475-20131203/41736_1 /TAXON_ID= ORGANISM="Unidentified sp., Strain CCMP1999" /NCGR_SAMPLE_ID=MMETSP1475 /ASSEMBLY_ACC=CAM_ASM_001111 /LENGTH=836 /DNA_ID=CAMNT_0044496219 /DNA_START=66 /DNA_END=2576 /DNA_ORIENTATION=+